MLIDPVLDKVELYQQLIEELQLQLAYAINTHVHADHITALATLRQLYGCKTVHGEHSRAQRICRRVSDGDCLTLDSYQRATVFRSYGDRETRPAAADWHLATGQPQWRIAIAIWSADS